MKDKKLYWKAKHTSDFEEEHDFLTTILKDNGVPLEDIPGFLRPTKKYLNDPFLMKNMDKAIEVVHNHVLKKSRILVRVDSDADGYTSSATLIQFLHDLDPDLHIDYKLNYDKHHGLTYSDMSDFERDQYGLVIVPDASMTVEDARTIKYNFDCDILVLDHHLIEFDKRDGDCYTNYCVAVNCTDGFYPNPNLCGAGVVQKFIEAYVDTYKEDPVLKTKYLDLVSLGQIADATDLRNLESRYYVIEGLKEENYVNELLTEIADRAKEDLPFGRYITSVGWKISPSINAVVRYGKPEEQEDFFQALMGVHRNIEYQPRRKRATDPLPPKEIHSLQKTMARVANNVKSRQDTEVRKFCSELKDQIEEQELWKNSVIFIDGTKVLSKGTVSGLVANRLVNEYLRPVVLMRQKNALEYGGSGRGYDKGNIDNFKKFLDDTGLIWCAGHEGAFGVSFKKADLEKLIAACNKKMPVTDLRTIYDCDWEIPAEKLKPVYVREVAENYAMFGNGVPAPTFAITGIKINAAQIQTFGEYGSFIRFTYNGIPFVKKYCPKKDFYDMTLTDPDDFSIGTKDLIINVVGQFVLNKEDDKLTSEVKIIAFDSKEDIPETNSNDNDSVGFDW